MICEDIVEYVMQADWEQLCSMIDLIVRRGGQLHPREDMIMLILPQNNKEERRRLILSLPDILDKVELGRDADLAE